MKKFYYTVVYLISVCCFNGFSQHKLREIPMLKIEDFEGLSDANSKFPLYTSSRVYYRIDSVFKISDKKFKIKIKTKVEMYKPGSFWDKSKVTAEAEPRMLEHEQGHFYIAHIAANRLEKQLAEEVFSENWAVEVRQRFNELNRKFAKMDHEYDDETLHGRNVKKQDKWNQWIKEQLQ